MTQESKNPNLNNFLKNDFIQKMTCFITLETALKKCDTENPTFQFFVWLRDVSF
jgi:hypothetical protein